jgi:hypothetical protein
MAHHASDVGLLHFPDFLVLLSCCTLTFTEFCWDSSSPFILEVLFCCPLVLCMLLIVLELTERCSCLFSCLILLEVFPHLSPVQLHAVHLSIIFCLVFQVVSCTEGQVMTPCFAWLIGG